MTTRCILSLLKARITSRSDTNFTIAFGSECGSPTTIRISCKADLYDLRDGDLLTLYTEVPLKGPDNG